MGGTEKWVVRRSAGAAPVGGHRMLAPARLVASSEWAGRLRVQGRRSGAGRISCPAACGAWVSVRRRPAAAASQRGCRVSVGRASRHHESSGGWSPCPGARFHGGRRSAVPEGRPSRDRCGGRVALGATFGAHTAPARAGRPPTAARGRCAQPAHLEPTDACTQTCGGGHDRTSGRMPPNAASRPCNERCSASNTGVGGRRRSSTIGRLPWSMRSGCEHQRTAQAGLSDLGGGPLDGGAGRGAFGGPGDRRRGAAGRAPAC